MTSNRIYPGPVAALPILALFLATSCGPSTPQLPVVYPADLTADCSALPKLLQDADVYDLGEYTVDVIGKYQDCRARHAKLASLVGGK